MVNPEERQPGNGWRADDPSGLESDGEDSMGVSSSGSEASVSANQSVVQRLTEIFVGNGDADLLLQRSDSGDGFLRWIRALDMQTMGACRADERLKPMLKMNALAGVADDRLLGHLNQHFEPAEVGVLARCLCIPLVTVRVGKIKKKGTLLSPTSVRGNLCLTLLPTSDLRISFNGDDGSLEKIATFSTEARSTDIKIEPISADKSGRSFQIVRECVVSYFWCCEKSMLLGNELLRKIKGLVMRRPSLAELSGISDSRLDCFAAHLRASLAGSMASSTQSSGSLLAALPNDSVGSSELHLSQSPSNCQKSARSRQHGSQGPKTNLIHQGSNQGPKTNLIHQGSLSPRPCSFKECLQRNLSSMRSAAREKLRRRGENFASCIDSISFDSLNGSDPSGSNSCQKDNLPKVNATLSFTAFNFFDVLGKSADLPFMDQGTQVPPSGLSPFSPHYCWCPPVGSALPIPSTESVSLPPLASLLSSAGPSVLLTSKPLLNLAEISPVGCRDLPTIPTSKQIPTFTPLICDPIIHIPVVGVCSSGQGYLVSAGPTMPSPIPPLNSTLGDPLLPNAESMVERGARETLRMLISTSSQSSSQLLSVLPCVLNNSNNRDNIILGRSRGLYRDMDGISSSISSMGLVLLSDEGNCTGKHQSCSKDSLKQREMPSCSSGTPTKSFEEGID